MPINHDDTPSSRQDQTQEQLAPVYTWDQVKEMRNDGVYPELTPGTVVTGFADLDDLDAFNHIVDTAMRQDLPANRASIYTGHLRSIVHVRPAMEGLKHDQRLYKPLENLRVVLLDADERHLADMASQREDGTPAISVAYVADCSSTGRGVLPGAVTILRTYAIGPTAAAPNTDPTSRLDVLVRTRKIPSAEWAAKLQESKDLGHMAVAAAIATAFPAGLPSLGKR